MPVYVRGSAADGWRWDAAAVEQAIGARTRALLLCNPCNPTGHVPLPQDVAAAVRVAEEHGVLVVTDEAYEASLWDDATLASTFGLADDVIAIRSLGKSLSLPQLRLFVGSDSRRGLANELTAVGLPVVDGCHFQAPGYARLPFGGAVEATAQLSNALSRWADLYAE